MFGGHLLLTAVLLLGALVFRCAGARPLLNTMDYRTINDPLRFNRFVAARMLFPASVAACCAALTYWKPMLGVPLIFIVPLSVLGFVIWVGVGSKQFASGTAGRSQRLQAQDR